MVFEDVFYENNFYNALLKSRKTDECCCLCLKRLLAIFLDLKRAVFC